MDNKKLLKLITKSLYNGYRLGDIVLNFPCNRDEHIKRCYLPHNKNFYNSLAIKYTNLYKGDTSLGIKIKEKCSLKVEPLYLIFL